MKRILLLFALVLTAGLVSAQKPDSTKKSGSTVKSQKTQSDTTGKQQRITVTEEGMSGKKKNAKTKNAEAPAEKPKGNPPVRKEEE